MSTPRSAQQHHLVLHPTASAMACTCPTHLHLVSATTASGVELLDMGQIAREKIIYKKGKNLEWRVHGERREVEKGGKHTLELGLSFSFLSLNF